LVVDQHVADSLTGKLNKGESSGLGNTPGGFSRSRRSNSSRWRSISGRLVPRVGPGSPVAACRAARRRTADCGSRLRRSWPTH